jgi:hypothetical protein
MRGVVVPLEVVLPIVQHHRRQGVFDAVDMALPGVSVLPGCDEILEMVAGVEALFQRNKGHHTVQERAKLPLLHIGQVRGADAGLQDGEQLLIVFVPIGVCLQPRHVRP